MSLFGGIKIAGRPDPENVRRLDLLPIPMLRRMQRLGIAIDPPHFHQLTSELSKDMDGLRDEIACEIPPEKLDLFCSLADAEEERDDNWSPINVESGAQLAKLLFDVLGVGRGRDLKRTAGGERISTGKKQLEVCRHDHPIIPLILQYRERSKLKNTYTEKLPRVAKFHPRGNCCPVCELKHVESTWRVHTEFTTTRTDTGRFASKNPNLQNCPTRTKLGQKVLAGFVASPGCRLYSADFSQIELRALAHIAACASMIEVYRNNGDIHDDTCHKALGVPLNEKPDKIKHRMAAKRVNFGIQNGTTEKGLYMQLVMDFGTNGVPIPDWLTEDWCKKFIAQWLAARPEVPIYFDNQYYRARRYKAVWEPFGRIRRIPEVNSVLSWIAQSGLRYAQNMPVTSFAAGMLKLAMGEIEEELGRYLEQGIWCWPLLTIHDEIIVEAEEEYVEAVGMSMERVMDNVMVDKDTGENLCRVPILSDGHSMERWMKG